MSHSTLTVSLGDRSYPIHCGRDLVPLLAAVVDQERSTGRKVVVITDENVADAQGAFLQRAFAGVPKLVLPAGEGTKCFRSLEQCCDFLAASGLDRSGRVFAVGGGVMGDLAGFAAAAFFRGGPFYQVPTTLLAMVDSSVGGKTGINLTSGKNLVGAFHQPLAVFADLDTLLSLPGREFSAGMAEVIKHGLLADGDLFAQLEALPRLQPGAVELPELVRRNCAIKAGVVSADERELAASDGRALLNLGHTFGHAIEAVAGYGSYLHGEAISVGLVLAARLSEELGRADRGTAARIASLLERYALPVSLRERLPVADLLAAASRDKKARAGKLRYVILDCIGKAATCDDVDPGIIRTLWMEAGAH